MHFFKQYAVISFFILKEVKMLFIQNKRIFNKFLKILMKVFKKILQKLQNIFLIQNI